MDIVTPVQFSLFAISEALETVTAKLFNSCGYSQHLAMKLSRVYIKLRIYQTYLAGPLDFGIMRFDCIGLWYCTEI